MAILRQTLLFLALICLNCNAELGHFWHISDVHWDKEYSRTGNPENLCHGQDFVTDNGFYGNSLCDTSSELMDLSIRAMAILEPNPDFILWTGDNAPHMDYPNATWDSVLETCRVVVQLLNQNFPSSVLLPVLGNHDAVPSDQFPANDPEFYQAYLTEGNWSHFIQEDQWDNFLKGGYYSTVIKPGLKVMVMNTCLYMTSNKNISEEESDPSGQFNWLLEELQASRNATEKVIVTGHVPPGYFATGADELNLKPPFNDKLIELFANNSDVILTTIFGHEHMDTFRLFKDQAGNFRSQALLGSSVDVWIVDFMRETLAINAGIRLYDYDLSMAVITDYRQFYLDFMQANENVTNGHVCSSSATSGGDAACVCSSTTSNACALMQLLYRPTLTYNVPDLSTDSMVRIYENLQQNSETFEVFYNHSSLDYVLTPCDPTCKKWYLCSIANITDSEMKACANSTISGQ